MTKAEIVKETVEFYSEDPKRRSINQYGSCVYNGNNDTHCAVGRCFLPEIKSLGDDYMYNTEVGVAEFEHKNIKLDDLLEERYRGHTIKFWQELQTFHDIDSYFNETGLTVVGRKKVEKLYKLFGV